MENAFCRSHILQNVNFSFSQKKSEVENSPKNGVELFLCFENYLIFNNCRQSFILTQSFSIKLSHNVRLSKVIKKKCYATQNEVNKQVNVKLNKLTYTYFAKIYYIL
jgi:hypothetical protein